MPTAPPYPIFLHLQQSPVLIVGGGEVGLRKAKSLLESAARITVVSPQFHPDFDSIADLERIAAPYNATHMAKKQWRLVFAATNSKEVNAQVYKHGTAAGIFVCRCDDPAEGDFSSGATQRLGNTRKSDGRGVHAVANSGGVLLTVYSAGASPVLSMRIARQAAAAVDPTLPALANLLYLWRAQVKIEIPEQSRRAVLLRRLASEEMEATLREHGEKAANALFHAWLAEARDAGAGTMPPSSTASR